MSRLLYLLTLAERENRRQFACPATPPSTRKRVRTNKRIPSTPPSSPSPAPTSAGPRLVAKFDGRVYRSASVTVSPSRKGKRTAVPAPAELLGTPDEMVIDSAYEAVSGSSREVNLLASPTLRASKSRVPQPLRAAQSSDSDSTGSDLEIEAPSPRSTTIKRQIAQTVDSALPLDPATVDLPDTFETLLSLHAALERALMLHLATEGKAGQIASSITFASTSATDGTSHIKLPNLVTYTKLRPIVERDCGRAFI